MRPAFLPNQSYLRVKLTKMPSLDNYRFQGGQIELRANDDDSFKAAQNALKDFSNKVNLSERKILLYCNEDAIARLRTLSDTRKADTIFASSLQNITDSIGSLKLASRL